METALIKEHESGYAFYRETITALHQTNAIAWTYAEPGTHPGRELESPIRHHDKRSRRR